MIFDDSAAKWVHSVTWILDWFMTSSHMLTRMQRKTTQEKIGMSAGFVQEWLQHEEESIWSLYVKNSINHGMLEIVKG
ncbi:hypothetical protein LINPERPRIM_LOCUS35816, partial [Linum perenne]